MKKTVITLFAVFALLSPQLALAVMTSTNYTIIFDAVGVSGGEFLTSTSYSLSETIGETPVLTASSTSYKIEGGYQAAVFGTLSFSVDTNSINLGTLTTVSINSANVNATVSNDSAGYVLSINSAVGAMPAAVTGGVVVAGTEAYGFSASGSHSAVVGDVPVAGGTIVASTTAPVASDVTTISFKATASPTSVSGNYSQAVDLVASANY